MTQFKSFAMLAIHFVGLQAAIASSEATTPCGVIGAGWAAYKDEKCFKIIEAYQNWERADIGCRVGAEELLPALASVQSQEEQRFVAKLAFETKGIETSVWIGAVRNDKGDFEWVADQSAVGPHTNWAVGSPTGQDGRNCVEMLSPFSRHQTSGFVSLNASSSAGEWKDVGCSKGNFALCQKNQVLSLAYLTRVVLQLRANLDRIVPVGFIYTQLPEQADPTTLWPGTQWVSVSSQYAGLFFRTEGDDGGQFGGQVQQDFSPLLTRVESTWPIPAERKSIDLVPGTWTPYLWTGDDVSGFERPAGIRMFVSAGETRPKNRAVRIWKRVA